MSAGSEGNTSRSGEIRAIEFHGYAHAVKEVALLAIRDLQTGLDNLLAARSVPDRYRGQQPSNYKSELDVLNSLREYPLRMQKHVMEYYDQATDEPSLMQRLQSDSQRVLRCSRFLQEWFNAAERDSVPVAIHREVESAFINFGISDVVTIITTGPLDEIETHLDDVRETFILPDDMPTETYDKFFTAIRVPVEIANAPRRWPIILGHEIGHHALRAESEKWLAKQPPGRFLKPVEAPDAVLKGSRPPAETLVVWHADLIDTFPFAELKYEIKTWTDRRRLKQRIKPPQGIEAPTGSSLPSHMNATDAQLDGALIDTFMMANAWLTEIICDLIMVRSCGPVGVVALSEQLIATNNMRRRSQTHPPGSLRILLMQEFINRQELGVLGSVLEEFIIPGYEVQDSQVDTPVPLLWSFLYEGRDKIFSFVDMLDTPAYEAINPERQQAVICAVDQLAWGVPPHTSRFDAFRDSGVGLEGESSSAVIELTVEDILNASCLAVQLQRQGRIEGAMPIDRLALKAIETLQVSELAAKGKKSADFTPLRPHAYPPEGDVCATNGGLLGAGQIQKRLAAGRTPDRLIITPMTLASLSNPSIDLRLGTRFITFHRSAIASFDAMSNDHPRGVQREHEVSLEQPFMLHPGEVVLASALEYIALPHDVAAQVITRSSYGRLGLITATAVQVHPSYRGCLTLELVNLGNVPLALHPGEQVAQLVFFQVGSDEESTPKEPGPALVQGSFVCPTGPEFPDVRLDKDPWLKQLRGGLGIPSLR